LLNLKPLYINKMEVTRESILKAIELIDKNPILLKGRTSSTYDLIFEKKKYPPILVLSEANKINGGKELKLEDFGNSITIPFELLNKYGFTIEKKETSYFEEIIKFLDQSKTNDLKFSKYNKKFLDLDVKVSFGQGGPANIPWISFLRDGMSTSKGIYPVYLYYKNEDLLVLAYGISETNLPEENWPIEGLKTIEKYFSENNLKKPYRYGKSYIYKVYNIKEGLDKSTINDDLINILNFYKSIKLGTNQNINKDMIKFNYIDFMSQSSSSNLTFSKNLILRFVSSLTSKPFVILSGLSGSGKTKIAQSFVQWICESDNQYKIVPVGADWTNREPLVGYPNGLNPEEYITPDCGIVHLLYKASKPENANKPFFLILDEMNLSHVERYFADFLSIMESKDTIKLYTGKERKSLDGITIPFEIGWPKNLFIIGTVNIDETTYMFSPKVLDRANVIEFRITENEIKGFLENPGIPDLEKLEGQGVAMAESFLSIANKSVIEKNETLTNELVYFFNELKKVGVEFGYRSATEILQLIEKLKTIDPSILDNDCIDIAIMQKLLPKLHGSRSKLAKILIALSGLCVEGITKEEFEKKFDDHYKNDFIDVSIKYPISFEKLTRMYKNLLSNGFTSYAEA
jgi:5-methylcytosine-specific restriction protein B